MKVNWKTKVMGTVASLAACAMPLAVGVPSALADAGDVAINATNFPDKVFRSLVSEKDWDNNGMLSAREIENATYLSHYADYFGADDEKIHDLSGIQYLTNLESLDIENEDIAHIDLSANTRLSEIRLYNTGVTDITLPRTGTLTSLTSSSNEISTLDTSGNPKLKELTLSDDGLQSLDLSKNTALQKVDVSRNYLTSLDLSKNTALQKTDVSRNNLTDLDLSKNINLTTLDVSYNDLTSIDLSKNTALRELNVESNDLASLDLSKNAATLQSLRVSGKKLTTLDVSQLTKLTSLTLRESGIESLDLSKNTELTDLSIFDSKLLSLDLRNNKKLNNDGYLYSNPTVDGRSVDLKKLDPAIDVKKISNVKNGKLTGSTLIPDTYQNYMEYQYDHGNSAVGKLEVTILFSSSNRHPITISNVKVSHITDTTADVTFDYTFDRNMVKDLTGKDASKAIKSICFVAGVQKTLTMTPAETFKDIGWAAGPGTFGDPSGMCTSGVLDGEGSAEDEDNIYGLQTGTFNFGGRYTGYDFYRYYNRSLSEIKDKGSFTMTLRGLQPSTWYGNKNLPTGDDMYPMNTSSTAKWLINKQKMKDIAQPYGAPISHDPSTYNSAVYKNTNYGTPIEVDMNQLFLGAHITTVDYEGELWTSVGDDAVQIPSFTTAAKGSVSAPEFTDVNSGTPHYEDIEWLAASKISEGYKNANGTYRFEGMTSVYRQDMAAFLRRLAVKNNIADAADWTPSAADWKKFKDVDKNTPHAEDILWLAHAGISEGWKESDGKYTFRGMSPVVRQDMAAFLKRLAAKAGKADGITPVSNFKDVSDTTPHADDIAWLAGAKITEGWKESDGKYTFRGMNKVVRQDMAAFLHRLDTLLNK